VLGQRAVRASHAKGMRGLRHVLSGQTTAGTKTKAGVEGHQGAADLLVGSGIDLAALEGSKEFVEVIHTAATNLAKRGRGSGSGGGLMAQIVRTRRAAAHRGRLLVAIHGRVVRRMWRGRRLIVVRLTVLRRSGEVALVSTAHMAMLVVHGGRSCRERAAD